MKKGAKKDPFRISPMLGFSLLALLGFGILSIFLLLPSTESTAAIQPISFNHKVHVKKEPCSTCHRYYSERKAAGRPDLAICMDCHTNPVGESAEEEKLRQIAQNVGELRWRRITRVPPHVRFSHQRHVAVGRVECRTCHGDIAAATQPPSRPLLKIDMNFCLACHRAGKVRFDRKALVALRAKGSDREILSELREMAGTSFRTREDLAKALDGIGEGNISADFKQSILQQAVLWEPISTDCIACHR